MKRKWKFQAIPYVMPMQTIHIIEYIECLTIHLSKTKPRMIREYGFWYY